MDGWIVGRYTKFYRGKEEDIVFFFFFSDSHSNVCPGWTFSSQGGKGDM
jgi:hypothetical protein